ncbi:hypothetical protein MUY14_07910 [Amycolatopsis sp. FBCC-B4732]|uniref:hypothetical protein n=1 Tax=Amycolatopsis sp. FBCC-B4732 TaxID=3079339 RepID=UPI001FF497D2|nr:hypothetical protein [Amycolatopsis sp. FBCC-B4732]UOX90537.1 hypothetical protein MUY14_07910 [Amycolatopsis sp. FBCC-B4732]
MRVGFRTDRTVAVHPGLFFLVDGLLGTGHICAFGSDGIAFASALQSPIVTVDIEFPAEPDPAGLEHWSSTVLPEHCVRVPGQAG